MEEKRLEAGWQSLRQVKSVDAYKNMGYEQFQTLLDNIRHTVAHTIFRVSLVTNENQRRPVPKPQTVSVQSGSSTATTSTKKNKNRVNGKKVGRNDPCPCGSGKKYKHCHGR